MFRNFPILFLLLAICGCTTVGPDYKAPDPVAPDKWNSQMEDGLRKDTLKVDDLALWWEKLNDQILNNLMQKALEGNLDLALAKERIQESRAKYGMTEAGLFPTLDASGSYTKRQTSENLSRVKKRYTDNMYKAGFDASWELDIFGGTRRAVEAAKAEVQAQEAGLLNTLVSLSAEVANTYVSLRTYQARLAVAKSNIKTQENSYELTKSRYDVGLTDELAVQQATYNLASTRSSLSTLYSGIESTKNKLAILLGKSPGAVDEMVSTPKGIPETPLTVAVGIPAEALRQRPDIQKAERELAAQTARIGGATADLYPKFKLTGSIGLESFDAGDFFTPESNLWSFGPSISWRIFDAGAIKRNIDVQTALQKQYLIKYQNTVLKALGEVENALTNYAQEQIKRQELKRAVDAAEVAADLAMEKYLAGLITFTDVLDAQRYQLSFQDQLASSEGTVITNFISIYKTLGGGWQSYSISPVEEKEVQNVSAETTASTDSK
ncbi:efflux transporter outer membrane subunit [Maridesulfovibrio sp.]|uniref:efflux transporter outer membrane subunit n=1 Tax=Maridesulfovibrio sp. TaxID=2795000 RepID=UPI0029C9D12A|nr:efflux transporter outer membrane subunit [Maridesulfovibrio sp.]